jgi:D-3-phosphoglycerate dehydrogenase / 2-oxoglutarate reductase
MLFSFEHRNDEKAVLITDDCHPLLFENFEKAGFRVDFEPEISYESTKNRIKNYEGLIINSKIMVDSAFLDLAKRLKFVGRLGSGMEIVDRKAAAERGILVVSSPEGNRNAVAEQAIGMLLALANNLLRADREVRQKTWHREKNRGWELAGKTLGIIGFGHTGSQFARKLTGFDLRTLAFDKYLNAGFATDFAHVEEVSLEKMCAESDIISLHLPLTAETKGFADADFFAKCRAGFVLINTSRGNCVKTANLISALESGHCAGACLDVFENEKPATFSEIENALFERLYQFENVVLSPHIAGWTHESKRKMAETILEKLRKAGAI